MAEAFDGDRFNSPVRSHDLVTHVWFSQASRSSMPFIAQMMSKRIWRD